MISYLYGLKVILYSSFKSINYFKGPWCYNNVWLLKRPGSEVVILSASSKNHFNNRVRGGDSRMKSDGDDVPLRDIRGPNSCELA